MYTQVTKKYNILLIQHHMTLGNYIFNNRTHTHIKQRNYDLNLIIIRFRISTHTHRAQCALHTHKSPIVEPHLSTMF